MNKVFVGGSRRITRLSPAVCDRIANIVEKRFPILVGDANGADKASKADELRRIANRHGVEHVRAFGSFVRGEAGPESDLDLLVRLRPGHGFADFMAFCEEAEAVLGRRVDVVTEDGLSPYLRDRVLAEAVPL